METKYKVSILSLFLSIILILISSSISLAGDYNSLKGVKEVKAVFDFRVANPKVAAVHLDLMHKTFNDSSLTIDSKKPEFVIIFMGPAVKLVSKSRDGFTEDQHAYLDKIAGIVTDMAKNGIKLEICDAAVHLTGGDTGLILPEIKHVPNGWISAIGYQLNRYALISDF